MYVGILIPSYYTAQALNFLLHNFAHYILQFDRDLLSFGLHDTRVFLHAVRNRGRRGGCIIFFIEIIHELPIFKCDENNLMSASVFYYIFLS